MAQRKTKVAALAAVMIAVVLAVGLSTAEATRTVRLTSRVTITDQGLTFSGRVRSNSLYCTLRRKVTLYRTKSLKLGTATASSLGAWTITASGSAGISLGHFYAKVGRRTVRTVGTTYVCKAGISKKIPFTQ